MGSSGSGRCSEANSRGEKRRVAFGLTRLAMPPRTYEHPSAAAARAAGAILKPFRPHTRSTRKLRPSAQMSSSPSTFEKVTKSPLASPCGPLASASSTVPSTLSSWMCTSRAGSPSVSSTTNSSSSPLPKSQKIRPNTPRPHAPTKRTPAKRQSAFSRTSSAWSRSAATSTVTLAAASCAAVSAPWCTSTSTCSGLSDASACRTHAARGLPTCASSRQ
mmetsp:Transcript_29645/g.74595  ORF Transcript_29645/g.74595 Transcript_29645/m.74595 type:complete len:218 (-) Transcript_29645:341-994(-)